jgi:hypothetical protein
MERLWYLQDALNDRDEDISSTMMRRASCTNELKYSMDIKSNISLMVSECKILDVNRKGEAHTSTRNQLLRLWTWIDRVEGLVMENTKEDGWEELGGSSSWSTKNLSNAGAWRLLQFDEGIEAEMQIMSDTLCCMTYDSDGRRYVFDCQIILLEFAGS